MSVIVANFGQANWAWPDCLDRNVIVIMDDERVHRFQLTDDRAGYVAEAIQLLRLRGGEPVTPIVASRWFNLVPTVQRSVGDLWVHSDTNVLWWCRSLDAPATSEIMVDPQPRNGERGVRVVYYRKPCSGWSSKDGRSRTLSWSTIHPKAKAFLATMGTFATLAEDNAAYALALIEGRDLRAWHDRSDWKAKLADARGKPGRHYDVLEVTIAEAVQTMFRTGAASGSTVTSMRKDKQIEFASEYEAERYIKDLFETAKGICALTGLEMQTKDGDDSELRLSIDRKDSGGHYVRGNVQLVCRFANRWKSASSDAEFTRLLSLVRSVQA